MDLNKRLNKRLDKELMNKWPRIYKINITPEEADFIIMNETKESQLIVLKLKDALNAYSERDFYRKLIRENTACLKKWDNLSSNYSYLYERAISETYYSANVINKLTKSENPLHLSFAINKCELSFLENIFKSSVGYYIKRDAYLRLGVGAIDKMIVDKNFRIRRDGVKLAPINYKKLSSMVGEGSNIIIRELIHKADKEALVFLLGHKYVKNNTKALKIINARLEAKDVSYDTN